MPQKQFETGEECANLSVQVTALYLQQVGNRCGMGIA